MNSAVDFAVGDFVLIEGHWYLVDDIPFGEDFFFASDEDGAEYEFNLGEVDECKFC